MEVPDIVGRTLGDARVLMDNAGIRIHSIVITAPPREKYTEYDDCFRVIRTKVIDNEKVELLICKPL